MFVVFQWYPFLAERVIYLRYDIALRAMIYAFGIWRNGYYIIFSRSGNISYSVSCISYRKSDISLKNHPIWCLYFRSINTRSSLERVGIFTFSRFTCLRFRWGFLGSNREWGKGKKYLPFCLSVSPCLDEGAFPFCYQRFTILGCFWGGIVV